MSLTRSLRISLSASNARIVAISFREERGIQRVPEDAPLHSFTHRLCADVTLLVLYQPEANNVAVGLLGPLVYVLSFVDSALLCSFWRYAGWRWSCVHVGLQPSIRKSDDGRCEILHGLLPSKIARLLNIIIMLGYGLIDCLIGGPNLVSSFRRQPHRHRWHHHYCGHQLGCGRVRDECVSPIREVGWIAQTHCPLSSCLVVLGLSLTHQLPLLEIRRRYMPTGFHFVSPPLFVPLCTSGMGVSAADYSIYCPASTQKCKTFLMTFTGLALSFSMTYLMEGWTCFWDVYEQNLGRCVWSVRWGIDSCWLNGLGDFGARPCEWNYIYTY